ncbi:L-threonylcarbamoyladenylate synthase [Methanotrichaceae archaeon M04Ac]|uniref:L-threonylcarbamoyladenylate synthase n=1 Tax=Candidatus Methanocrinis alkalitolerans TaxID=3033395 RepID=A0ABT5XG63_9EURY|nr:L-threonylcarbamoyladenylate synthase [Candidatus Methanocrinis alkalitolerans]MCR3883262.1 L-threonylcarbamoyladenylate synthase [Methanothrix sp.]MDF0593708.1 L-threonylcarbamoyladenylate synthase [Candidatus Methanocrinis alkalitolerans]
MTTSAARTAKVLAQGGTVVYPTETVYGIGASVYFSEAVERVFEIKGRPRNMPLSVAVASFDMMGRVARIGEEDLPILRKLLPGPVTVLIEKSAYLPDNVTAGSDRVGIRFPDHPVALELIGLAGPITSTSANLSGRPPPASIEELDPNIAEAVDVVLDGGRSRFATPSTLVDLAAGMVIREGAGMDKVREVLG